jgi:serine/threonine protein kinase
MTSDSHQPSNSDAAIAEGSFPDLHPTITLPESVIPMLELSGGSDRGATEMLKPESSSGAMDHIPGYEISAAIGRGAMGVVYRARQIKLQRLVALKVLVGRSHASQEDVARFNSEAITIAQIQHPNVMQIFDVGEYNGFPYLAAEYVDGGTLENKMNAGKMAIAETIRLMYQIARGVGAAHSKGVVHRDLKPSNILLTADGVPKVADFGLAKQLGPENTTMTGSVMGTPAYMAPEQAAGQSRRIGPQTDVYALGVILYQCLTGDVPLKGDSLLETLERIRDTEPIAVRNLRADVPEEVEEICERCLKKIPTERYPSADSLADELGKIAAGWETIKSNISKNPPRKPASKQSESRDSDAKQNKFLIPTIICGIGVVLLLALFAINGLGKKPAPVKIIRADDKDAPTKPTVDHNALPPTP